MRLVLLLMKKKFDEDCNKKEGEGNLPQENITNFISLYASYLLAGNSNRPLNDLMDKVWSQKWFFEDKPPQITQSIFASHKQTAEKESKEQKNLFLFRHGVGRKDTFTLEICLKSSVKYIQKYTVTTVQEMLRLVNKLNSRALGQSHFTGCDRGANSKWNMAKDAVAEFLRKKKKKEDEEAKRKREQERRERKAREKSKTKKNKNKNSDEGSND